MTQHDIADRNIERLLGVAYKPEPIDPAFLLETEEKLLAAARDERRTQQASPDDAAKLLRIRRRLGWAMAAAAAVLGVLLVQYAKTPSGSQLARTTEKLHELEDVKSGVASPLNRPGGPSRGVQGLTAKVRPEPVKPQQLAVGETLATKQGERRRVSLEDGSLLFVNE